MKTIKYWLYYEISKNEEPALYAYTDDRKLKNMFENQRNMSMFKKVKKDLNIEEVNYLANEYQHNILVKSEIDVYDKKSLKWSSMDMVLTEMEKLDIGNMAIFLGDKGTLVDHASTNPLLFNDEIKKALKTIGYNDIYFEYVSNNNFYLVKSFITPDLLGIFIRLYGHTLKGGN